MEAVSRHEAIHAIADFVETTEARMSMLREAYLTEYQQHNALQLSKLQLDQATLAVNSLLPQFSPPITFWHESPQLQATVRMVLHKWNGFSTVHENKVVWHATCILPGAFQRSENFALDTRIFANSLRTQHPLAQ